ncbi:fungal-specific transcription factor domain-containing protein [Xylogone sp. PMI_703]|nr:fungal-specific transcription factor domain-containing protein [Xylogone sp. PMI_703]
MMDQALKIFFQKAKCLYDLDCEPDRVSVIQALLLMTFWFDTPTDQKDAWHWMGISLSFANSIGLNRNPEGSTMDPKRHRLWKRLWWSCFMRDRLIAIALQKPSRITDEDFDVPMLSLDDFDIRNLQPETARLLGHCAGLYDINLQTKIAILCIETAKLCRVIGHVLATQYDVRSRRFGTSTETTMVLLPKTSTSTSGIFQVMKCDQELDQWHDSLPGGIEYKSQELIVEHNVLKLQRALLTLIYFTTSSALHRPQLRFAPGSSAVASSLLALSSKRVNEAAIEISHIASDLYELDLIRFLSATGVMVLIPAILVNLSDFGSKDEITRDKCVRQNQGCVLSLHQLRQVHSSADLAFSVVETAYRNANVNMSLEASETESTPDEMDRRLVHQTAVTASCHNNLTLLPDVNISDICSNITMTPAEAGIFLNPPVIDLNIRRSSPRPTFVSDAHFHDLINDTADNDFLYRKLASLYQ